MRLLPVVVLISIILFSCSVEKRAHLSGYHIEWKNTKVETLNSTAERTVNRNKQNLSDNLKKSTADDKVLFQEKELVWDTQSMLDTGKQQVDSSKIAKCDTISLKNGTKILAKVTEITLDEVRYKNCDYIDGPSISVAKSKISYIKYKTGKKENIIYEDVRKDAIKEPKKKFEFIGLGAFLLAVANAIFGILLISAGLLSELYIIPAFIGISAIALAIYSIYTYHKNPGVYSKNAFPIIAMIIGLITALLALSESLDFLLF